MDHLHQIDIKIFAKTGQDIPAMEFVAVLQRWIQEHTFPGVHIDVADYSHIHQGAGVILVAHEHNVSVDFADGRMGLLFHRKEPLDGSLPERIATCLKLALTAASQLQDESEFKGRLEFDSQSFRLMATDRLNAANDDANASALRDALSGVATGVYGGDVVCELSAKDARSRIAIDVKASGASSFAELIEGCSTQEVG